MAKEAEHWGVCCFPDLSWGIPSTCTVVKKYKETFSPKSNPCITHVTGASLSPHQPRVNLRPSDFVDRVSENKPAAFLPVSTGSDLLIQINFPAMSSSLYLKQKTSFALCVTAAGFPHMVSYVPTVLASQQHETE